MSKRNRYGLKINFLVILLSLTGAPLAIHPGRDPLAPFEILDILEQAGADISHTKMSHLDRTFSNNEDYIKLAKRGCYLSLDQFGIETSHYQVNIMECILKMILLLHYFSSTLHLTIRVMPRDFTLCTSWSLQDILIS